MAWQNTLGTAASISSLLQIACGVTKFGYKYFSNVRDAHSTREEYLKESRALVVVLLQLKQVLDSTDLQKYQDAATQARRAQLSAVITDCGNGLSKIEATLGKAMGFWGVLWPLQQEQIRGHITAFQQYRSMLDSFVSANVLATTAATLSRVDPMFLSHERAQLLFAFPRPDTISKPRVLTCPGTGKWFLESAYYQQWLLPSASVDFIWCYGPPGVGKSGLASLVVAELIERQALGQIHLCYFFCDFAAQEKQTVIHLLQCIVYQLIEQGDEGVINCAKECLRHFDAFKNPDTLANVITRISGFAKPLFLVLDAEDELICRDDLKKYLLGFKSSGCKTLVTSRDRMPSGLNGTTTPPTGILELKMECPAEDMIKHATERFKGSPFQAQISTEFMNQIAQKSNGMLVRTPLFTFVDAAELT
jgi:Cdc6-like AAA superfamily ATPase